MFMDWIFFSCLVLAFVAFIGAYLEPKAAPLDSKVHTPSMRWLDEAVAYTQPTDEAWHVEKERHR